MGRGGLRNVDHLFVISEGGEKSSFVGRERAMGGLGCFLGIEFWGAIFED